MFQRHHFSHFLTLFIVCTCITFLSGCGGGGNSSAGGGTGAGNGVTPPTRVTTLPSSVSFGFAEDSPKFTRVSADPFKFYAPSTTDTLTNARLTGSDASFFRVSIFASSATDASGNRNITLETELLEQLDLKNQKMKMQTTNMNLSLQ